MFFSLQRTTAWNSVFEVFRLFFLLCCVSHERSAQTSTATLPQTTLFVFIFTFIPGGKIGCLHFILTGIGKKVAFNLMKLAWICTAACHYGRKRQWCLSVYESAAAPVVLRCLEWRCRSHDSQSGRLLSACFICCCGKMRHTIRPRVPVETSGCARASYGSDGKDLDVIKRYFEVGGLLVETWEEDWDSEWRDKARHDWKKAPLPPSCFGCRWCFVLAHAMPV